ncbi:dihydrofolate reductase-like domain-containing protein [Cunninghamella echinulata]|nr:dihydrofolate reductase-like domain-containing protein [Cunninghamella echinulata]
MTIQQQEQEHTHPVIAVAAALAHNGGIGYQQDLPWKIPGDWEWFQKITTKAYINNIINNDINNNNLFTKEINFSTPPSSPPPPPLEKEDDWHNVVILGRLTWESNPMQRKPLHNRHNIVVSGQSAYDVHAVDTFKNASLAQSLDKAIEQAKKLKKDTGRIFLLGGSQLYHLAIHQLACCTHILLTKIYHQRQDENNLIECDTFFPPIDLNRYRLASHHELQQFVQEEVPSGLQSHDVFHYEFLLYVRRS